MPRLDLGPHRVLEQLERPAHGCGLGLGSEERGVRRQRVGQLYQQAGLTDTGFAADQDDASAHPGLPQTGAK